MKKQRLFLLLSVIVLLLAGCGGKGNQVTEEQSVETEMQTVLEVEEDISEETEMENVTEQPEETPETTEPETSVSYSPQRVARLATEKTKAAGKIYIPDDLDRMLAEGTLSQEDYNACYPTDGAGYLEFYVATDLNEARDVSGTVKFNSEDDIAANIAGIYSSLPQQYFYIEYHGTVIYGDKECYVFYCYRA